MRAGTGADRIAEDVASALSSGVTFPPALFVNGEHYEGELDAVAVSAALNAADRRRPPPSPAGSAGLWRRPMRTRRRAGTCAAL
jgi:hypothetical protein